MLPCCIARRTQGERACRRCQRAGSCPMPPRDAAIKQHLGLAHHTAHRHLRSAGCRGGADPDDVKSVATIGLILSLDRFDPTRGHRFSSFAVPAIQGAIRHDQRDQWRPVHLPRRELELHQKVIRLQRQRQAQGQLPLAEQELSEQLGCSIQKLQQAQETWRLQTVVSLDGLAEEIPLTALSADHDDPMRDWLLDRWQTLPAADQELAEALWLEPVPRRELAGRLGISTPQLKAREQELLDQLGQSAMASKAAMVV